MQVGSYLHCGPVLVGKGWSSLTFEVETLPCIMWGCSGDSETLSVLKHRTNSSSTGTCTCCCVRKAPPLEDFHSLLPDPSPEGLCSHVLGCPIHHSHHPPCSPPSPYPALFFFIVLIYILYYAASCHSFGVRLLVPSQI